MTDEVSLYRPFGEGGELSGLDMKLLEFATQRLTGEQMFEQLGSPTGLSPARCIQRVKEIVKAQDYLSIAEQKSLLLLDFVRLRDRLWERIDEGTETKITKNGDVIDVGLDSAFYRALTQVLKEWRVTIDSMRNDVQGEEMTIRAAHAEIMMAAISVMFDRYTLRLEQHFDLYKSLPDAEEMRTIFEEVMPLGLSAVQAKVQA